MTEVLFYSGAKDKLLIACRLCAKALGQNSRLIVYAPDSVLLRKLDLLLWTFRPVSFLPHCFIHDDTELVKSTPIILSDKITDIPEYEILLNLCETCPPNLEKFQRVIEIANQLSEDKLLARKRYRFYLQSGFALHHYRLDNA